jgi:hypothetical protein
MALAGTAAVSRALLTKVVGKLLPFHCTLESEMKFEPTTLRVSDGPPCGRCPCRWLLSDSLRMCQFDKGCGYSNWPSAQFY